MTGSPVGTNGGGPRHRCDRRWVARRGWPTRWSWKDRRATGQGVLEDYANLAEGLLALYEATFDERWFTAARGLADAILERFVDPDGGFFDTAIDHERLVTRPKDVQDNATPSGSAVATLVLLRLSAFTGDSRYREAAERALTTITPLTARYPTAFAMWLQAIDLALAPVAEVAIVGDPKDEATQALLAVVRGGYAPNRVVALRASEKLQPRSRCSRTEPSSRVGPPPTSAAASRAASRSPTPKPSASSSPKWPASCDVALTECWKVTRRRRLSS